MDKYIREKTYMASVASLLEMMQERKRERELRYLLQRDYDARRARIIKKYEEAMREIEEEAAMRELEEESQFDAIEEETQLGAIEQTGRQTIIVFPINKKEINKNKKTFLV